MVALARYDARLNVNSDQQHVTFSCKYVGTYFIGNSDWMACPGSFSVNSGHPSRMWLLSPWNMPCVLQELSWKCYLILINGSSCVWLAQWSARSEEIGYVRGPLPAWDFPGDGVWTQILHSGFYMSGSPASVCKKPRGPCRAGKSSRAYLRE